MSAPGLARAGTAQNRSLVSLASSSRVDSPTPVIIQGPPNLFGSDRNRASSLSSSISFVVATFWRQGFEATGRDCRQPNQGCIPARVTLSENRTMQRGPNDDTGKSRACLHRSPQHGSEAAIPT